LRTRWTSTLRLKNVELKYIPKRRLTVELLVATLSQLRNQNILNFFSVVLSVIALGSCISVQFWAILCSMGVLFSRVWTIKLAREIGDEVALKRLPKAAESWVVYNGQQSLLRQDYLHWSGRRLF
jgi:hypothetical protein